MILDFPLTCWLLAFFFPQLQKCENQLPDQAFFRLHRKSSKCVSFECKNNPGVFIGVKDNHLALIKIGDPTEDSKSIENTIFKLS